MTTPYLSTAAARGPASRRLTRRRGAAVVGAAGAAGTMAAFLAAPLATLAAPSAQVTDTPAATLRVALNELGSEHVYLAALAIAAALGNRPDEFRVAAAAVDENTKDLGKAIGSVYGAAAETRFLALWRAHIGFFVDYTQGAATKDAAKQQQARVALDGYRNDIDAFLTGANPNLPRGAVATLFAAHVQHLNGAIDALAGGDLAGGYAMIYTAAHQTMEIMDPLAAAIVKQFPQRFAGATDAPAATLRVTLNNLGAEHVYLAGFTVAAALGGRTAEFAVAAAATDQNTQALGKAIGSVYGAAAETRFLALWRAHIGFFVDYTQGTATNDQAKKQKALADLTGYRNDIDAFLTGANPNLPRGAVATLFVAHVQHLTMAIDALAGGDLAGGYAMLRTAAQQTMEIMDPLAAAIVKQFPQRFAGAGLPRTGAGTPGTALLPLSLLVAGGGALLGTLLLRRRRTAAATADVAEG